MATYVKWAFTFGVKFKVDVCAREVAVGVRCQLVLRGEGLRADPHDRRERHYRDLKLGVHPLGLDRALLAELAEISRRDYEQNARRSADRLALSLSHLLPTFGAVSRAAQPGRRRRGRNKRLEERAANGTINRELAALKRLFALAIKNEKLYRRPHIEMLKENNTRQGFFEREQLDAVGRLLPEATRPVVTFAYLIGWRVRSEVLPLQWRQVDLEASTVRLEPGTTKNGEGRTVYMTPELRACREGQRAATDAVQRARARVVAQVFHRDGEPIKTFRKS